MREAAKMNHYSLLGQASPKLAFPIKQPGLAVAAIAVFFQRLRLYLLLKKHVYSHIYARDRRQAGLSVENFVPNKPALSIRLPSHRYMQIVAIVKQQALEKYENIAENSKRKGPLFVSEDKPSERENWNLREKKKKENKRTSIPHAPRR